MEVIKNAVKKKQVLMICYKGLPRMVEAYIYGANRNGKEYIRGFQIGGTSCTEEVGWKMFDVSQIQAMTVIPQQHFANARKGYAKTDPVITTVYAQV